MKKVFLLLSVLVGILIVVSCGAQSQPTESPPSHEHEAVFRVEVSRNGFNNTLGEFRLEVEAGQEVEITFTADKVGMYQLICDEHKDNMRSIITVVPN